MPTIREGIINPFDGVGVYKENIVDALDAIDRREVPFLAMLGAGMDADITSVVNSLKFPCTQIQHQWINDALIPNVAILSVAHAIGDASLVLTVADGEANYFYEGDQVAMTSGSNTSVFVVRGRNTTTQVLTVDVIANDANHVLGTKVFSLGRPAARGEQFATQGRVRVPTTQLNYTQIFGGGKEGVVSISGTEQATSAYGITNRLDYECSKKLQELAIKLEFAVMYGVRSASLPNDNTQDPPRFGGFYDWVKNRSGITRDASGRNLPEAMIRSCLDAIWDAGGNPAIMMMGLYSRSVVSDYLLPFVRAGRDDKIYGTIVNTYEYSHGPVSVSLSKWIQPSHTFILSPDQIGLGPLNGGVEDRSFHWESLPKTGDYYQRVVIGEYTAEWRNHDKVHAIIENTATAAS